MEFAVKLVSLFILFLSQLSFASLNFDDDSFSKNEYSGSDALRNTQDALMGYEIVQEKTNYWTKRLEKKLFGDYADKFLILAPFVTGQLEFNALDLNFYVNAREEESGVRYTYRF